MKSTLRILAILLLFFLGFDGIYGGFMLISDPSGGKFEWSLELLDGTPFNSFFIPGIVLLLVNGLFPVFVATITCLKKSYAQKLILFQGVLVLAGLTLLLCFRSWATLSPIYLEN